MKKCEKEEKPKKSNFDQQSGWATPASWWKNTTLYFADKKEQSIGNLKFRVDCFR